MAKTKAKAKDQRPPVAVAHVFLRTTDIPAAAAWLETVGMRPIFSGDEVAVLELRGGTHAVVLPTRRKPRKGTEAPFDLMVDDIAAMRRDLTAKGLKPGKIRKGRIHDTFDLVGPDGYVFSVTSSHAGRRQV
jgi:hypothetical protein